MKTKSQILIDNGFSVRLASHDDLISISKAMDEYAASVQKEYQIDFGNNLRCKVIVGGNNIYVYGAVNGWGDGIPPTDIIVKRLNPDLTFTESK